jgi:NADPH2:quinone reductase
MPRAIRIHANGGPEVLQWEDVTVGDPGPGEARVRHTAIGVNFIDTYHRSGLYKANLPTGLGTEAAGVVEAVGAGVDWVKPGDRVAYSGGPLGAYSESRVMPAERLVRLPDGVSDRAAATLMLKGLTVQYLFRQTYKLKAGDTILFHAAAGGVGLIACQWARALGVTMIGTVGSDEKAALAIANGCTHTIVYTRENFVERVKALTGGKGVPVVYDAIGKDTFPASLDCLLPRGLWVSFGNSSGAIPGFDILLLSQKGSLYATRPTLFTYAAKREDMTAMAAELFDLVRAGKIVSEPRQTFALKDAAAAHRALESRSTTGASVLLP